MLQWSFSWWLGLVLNSISKAVSRVLGWEYSPRVTVNLRKIAVPWRQRHVTVCEVVNNLPVTVTRKSNRVTCWSQVQRPNHYTTMPSNIRDLKGPVKICHSGTLKKRLSYSESCCTAAVCMMQNVRRGTHATVHAPNFLALWRRPIGPIIAATPGCFKVIVWINLFWVSIALIRCADPQRQNAYWNSTVSGIKRIISTVDGWISINVLSLWVCTSDECKKRLIHTMTLKHPVIQESLQLSEDTLYN